MGGSYKQCVQCGKRALSIATRCPACSSEFLTRMTAPEPPRWGRSVSPQVVAGTLAAAAILLVVSLGDTTGAPRTRSSVLEWDSTVTTASAHLTEATTRLDSATITPLPALSAGESLAARTWTSVRHSRSKTADLAAVLLPGDTDVADSLQRGWYRVALEGEFIGYVHRSTLTALPSPADSGSTDTPAALP